MDEQSDKSHCIVMSPTLRMLQCESQDAESGVTTNTDQMDMTDESHSQARTDSCVCDLTQRM